MKYLADHGWQGTVGEGDESEFVGIDTESEETVDEKVREKA